MEDDDEQVDYAALAEEARQQAAREQVQTQQLQPQTPQQPAAQEPPVDYAAMADQARAAADEGGQEKHSVGGFAGNVVSSALNFGGGMVSAAAHPVNTAENILKMVGGMSPVTGPAGGWQRDVAKPAADAAGEFYKQRYGGLSNVGETAYHDPVGLIADLSALLGGGEAALRGGAMVADAANAGRVANAARAGAQALKVGSEYTNPLAAITKPVSAGAGKILKLRSGLSPVEQAAVNYAVGDQRLSGTLDAATVTGNRALLSLRSLLKKSVMGSGPAGEADLAQKAAIEAKMGDLSYRSGPGAPQTNLTAGMSTFAKVRNKLREYGATATTAFEDKLLKLAQDNPETVQVGEEPAQYSMFGDQQAYDATATRKGLFPAPNVKMKPVMKSIAGPTETAGVKAVAQQLMDEFEQVIPEGQRQISPAMNLLKNILNRPNYVDLSTAIKDNSALLNAARKEVPALGTQAQRISGKLAEAYRQAIDDAAARIGPEASAALEEGRQATRDKYELGKLSTSIGKNPARAAALLTAGDDYSVPMLQTLEKHVPGAIPDLARYALEEVFRHTTEQGTLGRLPGAINKWNHLGDATKAILFGPDLPQEITNLLQYAKLTTGEMNPSGTAAVTQHLGLVALMLRDPLSAVAAMAGSRAMTKAMFDPEIAAQIKRTGRIPVPQPGIRTKVLTAPLDRRYLNTGRAVNAGIPPEQPQ